MKNINPSKKGYPQGFASLTNSRKQEVDSQALQDIIDVLKHPFQTSCGTCNGLGYIRSGKDCPTCEGSGKVQDDLFTP